MEWKYFDNITRKKVINKIIQPAEDESFSWITLKHCIRDNILWSVVQRTDKRTHQITNVIKCHQLDKAVHKQPGRKPVTSWGFRTIDETMSPLYYTCPLSYLDDVPVACEEWRKSVREYHRVYQIGDELKLKHCSIPYLVVSSLDPLEGTFNGATYRIPRSLIVETHNEI